MQSLEISLLDPHEVEEFTSVIHSLADELSEFYVPNAIESIKKDLSETRINVLLSDERNLLLIARSEGQIVGVRVAVFDEGVMNLYLTGVKEEMRRKGVARQIHEWTFEYLNEYRPDVHKLSCDTRTDNLAGIEILVKMGFEQEGVLKNHWHGQDYYLWGRSLRGKKE
jgi:ribosomal protein S18 acetylase RimI-like enzyme